MYNFQVLTTLFQYTLHSFFKTKKLHHPRDQHLLIPKNLKKKCLTIAMKDINENEYTKEFHEDPQSFLNQTLLKNILTVNS